MTRNISSNGLPLSRATEGQPSRSQLDDRAYDAGPGPDPCADMGSPIGATLAAAAFGPAHPQHRHQCRPPQPAKRPPRLTFLDWTALTFVRWAYTWHIVRFVGHPPIEPGYGAEGSEGSPKQASVR